MQFSPIEKHAPLARVPDAHVFQLLASVAGDGEKAPAHIALVGTFAPRKCGIATFTSDVFEQLGRFHEQIAIDVYALDHGESALVYEHPKRIINADDPESYSSVARQINASGVDAVWIQHEFGIYGDNDGEAICSFAAQIAPPLIVTFHTVLTAPSERQLRIMRDLVARASRIMVMSEHGRRLLMEVYGAPAKSIKVIHHGAPDRPFGRTAAFKERLGLTHHKVLMTFGLLGPGKGLERVIEALPTILAQHPEVIYRIVGATHPNLLAEEGETYREALQALAVRLGVAKHLSWENRFLETPELLDQLEASDIYVTPYLNLQQSTSGTLSYAVALGKAVVSTPYVHARELLADGIGVLVEPNSSAALAAAIIGLLDDLPGLSAMQQRAYCRGRQSIWPEFARESADLIRSVVSKPPREVSYSQVPSLLAVQEMTDGTGMLQHAIGKVPDRMHGYCLDDNARALMLVNVAGHGTAGETASEGLVYASFIQHAWNEDANRFRNFMRFDRTWCEEIGSEDSNGRALWALGQTVEHSSDPEFRWWAQNWFDRTARPLTQLSSPRAVAFCMLGASSILRAACGHDQATTILARGGDLLHELFCAARRPDWTWFEPVLAYDNPRLSQALIEAGDILNRPEWIASGLETLEWLWNQQTAENGNFRPIGSEGFGQTGAHLPFDQQPLEAQAAIEAAASAHQVTGRSVWLARARTVYDWFFGANDRGTVLADLSDGRCRDGVTPRGRNENCGAESILAFQLGHYSLTRLSQANRLAATPAIPLHAALSES
jgi:glycosyltransferase involved in cell wall biosynthesis